MGSMVEQKCIGSGSVGACVIPPPSVAAAAAANLHYNPYPTPLASYEDVAVNPKLFMDTLEKLHAAMGTKFMIPIIGGRDLDLHKLFVEVATRGGIEKILREKKWKEVTAVFHFPSTATNASFILRKYYFSLLHHYEQIYLFRALGWTPMPHVHGGLRTVPSLSQAAPTIQPQSLPQVVPSSMGSQVIGVIDGKFESGYLVTVTIGSQKLKGVLYQTAAPTMSHIGEAPKAPSSIATCLTPQVRRRRRRRKKSEIKRRDPAHPKPNRSGYNFFFSEQHARLKPLYHGRDREISRIIGELWTNLQESEKAVHQEKAANDKERYRREMEGYRERLRTGQVISDAVPIQQRLPLAGVDAEMADVKDETERESSEMFENEDEEDEYCSMSGSDCEVDASHKDEDSHVAAEIPGEDVAASSLLPGSIQTEEMRPAEVHVQGSDVVPVINHQDKTSTE